MTLNLNMGEFKEYLIKKKPLHDGVQYLFKFPNNYGASVVKHSWSYGSFQDLWELAVLRFDGDEWDLTYNTEITDDVIGHLTDYGVIGLLYRIQNLK